MSGKDNERRKEKNTNIFDMEVDENDVNSRGSLFPFFHAPGSAENNALNKLDTWKMELKDVIELEETKRNPSGLQDFISSHIQHDMTSAQTSAIKSGIFFLSSLMHQPRHEFYTQLIDTLRDEMMSKIQELSGELNNPTTVNKLRECLRVVFKMIHYPEVQPVVMKLMDTIGGKLRTDETARAMEILSMDKTLYAACPLGVKRRIWKQHPDLFLGEIFPIVNEYKNDCEASLKSSDKAFLMQMPKDRRKRDLVVKLVDMVGESSFLYARLVGCLREVYHRTHCSHFCTLRAEILLSLNDRKLTTLCNQDDTHHFAWVLDACVRDRRIDTKRAKELDTCYQQVPDKNSRDIRMLCSDPHVIHTTCISIIRAIEELLDSETLPKLSPTLRFLFILLSIGLKIPSQDIRMTEFQTSLVPRIASLIASGTYLEEVEDYGRWHKQRDAEKVNESGNRSGTGPHDSSNSTAASGTSSAKNGNKNGNTKPEAGGSNSNAPKTPSEELEMANVPTDLLPPKRAKLCRESYVATRVSQTLLQHHCLYAIEKKQTSLAATLFEIMNSMEYAQIRPEVLQYIVILSPDNAPWCKNSLFTYMRDKLHFRAPAPPAPLDRAQSSEPSSSGNTSGPSTSTASASRT